LVEFNYKYLGINFINTFLENHQTELTDKNSQDNPSLAEYIWYKDIIFFLQNLKPHDSMGSSKVRALNIKAIRYCLID
jgi:hypothetical protein